MDQEQLYARLSTQFSMHQLTSDETVTCQSMLAQEPSSRVMIMPTHHINEMGDMMGFRFASLFTMNADQTCVTCVRVCVTGSRAINTPRGTAYPLCGLCSMGTRW